MKILFGYSLLMLLATAAQADPTRPAPGWQAAITPVGTATERLPQLQLIKQTALGNVAVIDGNVLRQGQRYQQYLVRQIQDSGVLLEINGQQLMLPLHNTAIKHYEE